jgi:hypothetical protein
MRRLLALWLLGAGLLLWLRRLRGAGKERVRIFYGDGSSVTLEGGAPVARRLAALARAALP